MSGTVANGRLRPLPWEMLRIGKPVPGTVLDRDGKVLLRAGTPLDEEIYRRLSERGADEVFAGPDWPDRWPPRSDSPAKLARSLAACTTGSAARKHRRRHERRACRTAVAIELAERTDHGMWIRHIDATTIDVSPGGMAFEHDAYIHPGTELVASFDHLPSRPRIRGVVRSCFYTAAGRHRVGVEFLEARRAADANDRRE